MEVAIIGAGVGGLTLALSLIKVGIDNIHIYEASPNVSELGVGINILPHAMQVLERLGLLNELLSIAVATSELRYYTQQGQLVWKEKRGINAGYPCPQISIHRGHLIKTLHQAVVKRLGANRLHTNHKLKDFQRHNNGTVTAIFDNAVKNVDCLVACDGIHSSVRNKLYPYEGAPKWDGITMWRGVSLMKPFLQENAMVVAGRFEHRMVMYPISKHPDTNGNILINWIAKHQTTNAQTMPKQDWIHQVNQKDMPKYFHNFEFLNYSSLLKNSLAIYKYPQVDRDPLPNWNFTNVTLLGDAAHPMYPSGSNGASQAIIDAQCLAKQLVEQQSVEAAIAKYDGERRITTAKIVLANRQAGPEKCIDIVEARAPNGFENIADIITEQELKEITSAYKKTAGFDCQHSIKAAAKAAISTC